MIPHSLVGRFIFVKPCLYQFGPVGSGRWVFLAHIRPDGLMVCFSMQHNGVNQHHYPQQGERTYTAVASKRDDAAAEEMIRWLNEKLADPNNTLVDPTAALEVRNLMVAALKGSVEADVEAAREEEDETIKARFHELGKPVGPKAEPRLADMGIDAVKWAAEFRQVAIDLGYSSMDEGWLVGWFANALMAGFDESQRRHHDAEAEAQAEAEAEAKAEEQSLQDAIDALHRRHAEQVHSHTVYAFGKPFLTFVGDIDAKVQQAAKAFVQDVANDPELKRIIRNLQSLA